MIILWSLLSHGLSYEIRHSVIERLQYFSISYFCDAINYFIASLFIE